MTREVGQAIWQQIEDPARHGVKSRLMLQHPQRLTGYQFKFTYTPRENQLKVGKYHIFWLPRWLSGKQCGHQCRRCKRCWCNPRVRKLPWRRKWQPTPVFFAGKFHEQRSLVGYSPWGHKDLDTTEHTHIHLSIHPSIISLYTKVYCVNKNTLYSLLSIWNMYRVFYDYFLGTCNEKALFGRQTMKTNKSILSALHEPTGRDNRYVYK